MPVSLTISSTRELIEELLEYARIDKPGRDALIMLALARLLELHLFWAKGEK